MCFSRIAAKMFEFKISWKHATEKKNFTVNYINEGFTLRFSYKDLKGNKKCYSEQKAFIS